MIGAATYNDENERFVIADRFAKQEGWSSGESAGLVSRFGTSATSTIVLITASSWAPIRDRVKVELGATPRPRIDLTPHAGEWVVISENQIVEHGTDLADVVNRARQRGELKPYVVFVEQLEKGAARMSI